MVYKHPATGDTQIVKRPWLWLLFTPFCAIELIKAGKTWKGLFGLIPLFTLIWFFQYESILTDAWEKKGYDWA